MRDYDQHHVLAKNTRMCANAIKHHRINAILYTRTNTCTKALTHTRTNPGMHVCSLIAVWYQAVPLSRRTRSCASIFWRSTPLLASRGLL
jgi:hypothetical protein